MHDLDRALQYPAPDEVVAFSRRTHVCGYGPARKLAGSGQIISPAGGPVRTTIDTTF